MPGPELPSRSSKDSAWCGGDSGQFERVGAGFDAKPPSSTEPQGQAQIPDDSDRLLASVWVALTDRANEAIARRGKQGAIDPELVAFELVDEIVAMIREGRWEGPVTKQSAVNYFNKSIAWRFISAWSAKATEEKNLREYATALETRPRQKEPLPDWDTLVAFLQTVRSELTPRACRVLDLIIADPDSSFRAMAEALGQGHQEHQPRRDRDSIAKAAGVAAFEEQDEGLREVIREYYARWSESKWKKE